MPSPPPLKTKTRLTAHARTLVFLLIGCYALLILALSAVNAFGSERHWLSTVNLYLPQLFWAIPGPLLALALLPCRPRARWLVFAPLLPTLWVLGPLMGLSCAFPRGSGAPPEVRVMTYNVGAGKHGTALLIKAILDQQPELLLVQESGSVFEEALRSTYPHWNIVSTGELLVATSLPLSAVQNVALPKLREDPWKTPSYTRCVVRVGETDLVVYNLHFSTPRPAFEAIIAQKRQILLGRPSTGIAELKSNTAARLQQAQGVAEAVAKETVPVLVAGDFNAPMPSLLCRKLQNIGLREAFQVAGRGYGYTSGHELRFGEPFVRVDHLFVSPQLEVLKCFVGDVRASDHLPVIADLALSGRK